MNFLQTIAEPFEKLENRLRSYDEKIFRRFVLLLYLFFAAVNIITHEMWADELQAWMIAANSRTVGEFFSNMKFEDGHPPLWKLMLYVLSRFTHNPISMQYLHLTIAVASAYVFLRFAPFTRLQRLLFVFGYFPLYEYAAISRAYVISMLLIFVICAAYRAGAGKKYWLLAVLLFLLAQTSAYGFLIAVSIAVTLIFEFLVDKETREYVCHRKLVVLFSICIILTGLAISAAEMKPAPDFPLVVWTTRVDPKRLQETLATIWRSYVPIPGLKHVYWNSNIFPDKTVRCILAVPLLCFAFLIFARKRMPLVLFYSSTLLMLAFQYFVYIGYLRHFGHLFIMFVVCLWLERLYHDDTRIEWRFLQRAADYCKRHKSTFIGTLLAIHFASGVHASVMEWLYPFSQAKNTAAYIEQHHLDKLPIVGYVDYATTAVTGYLGRQIYYTSSDRIGSFVILDRKWAHTVDESTMLQRAHELAIRENSPVLLVLNRELKINDPSVNKLADFMGSLIRDENFHLYLLEHQSR